jgi:hypothetical protein
VDAHRRERLDVGVRGDPRLVAVTLELAADDVARNTFSFTSRSSSTPGPTGGSIASSATVWKRWFCTTSRSAPTSS